MESWFQLVLDFLPNDENLQVADWQIDREIFTATVKALLQNFPSELGTQFIHAKSTKYLY